MTNLTIPANALFRLNKNRRRFLRHFRASPQPALPLVVHEGSLFERRQPQEVASHSHLAPDPWCRYRAILDEDQAGPCTVAHLVDSSFELVVLKKKVSHYRTFAEVCRHRTMRMSSMSATSMKRTAPCILSMNACWSLCLRFKLAQAHHSQNTKLQQ